MADSAERGQTSFRRSGGSVDCSRSSVWDELVRATLLLLLLIGPVRADDPAFELERFDGERIRGAVTGLDRDHVRFADDGGREHTIPRDDVLYVRRIDERRPVSPRDVVLIANGDRLAARAVRGDEDGLVANWFAGSVEIPLETVRGIGWRLPRDSGAWWETVSRLRRDADDEGDRITLENGDTVAGEFRGIGPDGVSLAVAGAETSIPLPRVGLLAFDPTLVDLPAAPERTVLVRLGDGSRLTARQVAFEEDSLRIETTFGPTLRVQRTALAELRFTGGRARDLSDRQPVAYEFTPWLGTEWSWQRDLAVTGGPLQLGGRSHQKGLGMHATSRVEYDLEPADESFRATVGLDDSAGEGGSVVFVVRVDGREAYRSEVLRGGDRPIRIPAVDVRNAGRLEFVVERADRGDVLDRANWCDAVLTRAE